jgi:hypothetical protein
MSEKFPELMVFRGLKSEGLWSSPTPIIKRSQGFSPETRPLVNFLCGYACPTIILDCETLYFQNVYVYIIYTLEFELMITVFRRKRKQCPLTMDPRRVHHGS